MNIILISFSCPFSCSLLLSSLSLLPSLSSLAFHYVFFLSLSLPPTPSLTLSRSFIFLPNWLSFPSPRYCYSLRFLSLPLSLSLSINVSLSHSFPCIFSYCSLRLIYSLSFSLSPCNVTPSVSLCLLR